jgi:hypothetical protein
MTPAQYDEIEGELLRAIDAAELAANCARTSLCNLYTPICYALSDARLARGAAADVYESINRAADLLSAVQDKEGAS